MKHAILEYLEQERGRAYKTKELARALQLPKQGPTYLQLKAALRELQEEGSVERLSGSRWTFKLPEEEAEVPVVEERLIVGAIKELHRVWVLQSDDKEFREDIAVRKRSLNGAVDGDKVVARLLPQEHRSDGLECEVVEILGKRGRADVELVALARRHGLSMEFPLDVNEEADAIPTAIPRSEITRRLDLRATECFTIDPENAKDFDDAVSLREIDDGWELGVHIADVSHYVTEGTPMDREALRRGTSVYLVDGVFPMLPERVSNHICSLVEGQDRLTYSAIMQVTSRGTVKSLDVRKTVIRSSKRFTYEEVQGILDSGVGPHLDTLRAMERLASILMKKRFREGSVDFAVPEVAFRLDATGYPIEILPKARLMSMRMIEEFMLLANRCVAQHVEGMRPPKSFMYRIHDLPDPEKVAELLEFLRHLGIKVQLDGTSSKSFQLMIEQIRGRPEENVVQDVTIRSMAKAVYSERNIGHFGLGFKHYTHFTSPIRRYPDLMVHRLCAVYFGEAGAGAQVPTLQRIADIAKQSSIRERVAVEAERESIRIKQVEYMKRHEGDEFDAVIDGVTSWGFFVELIPTLVEGLVHVRTMEGDYFRFDKTGRQLVGERTGRRYRLGDTVRVRVARVDSVGKQIDFVLVEDEAYLNQGRSTSAGSERGQGRSGRTSKNPGPGSEKTGSGRRKAPANVNQGGGRKGDTSEGGSAKGGTSRSGTTKGGSTKGGTTKGGTTKGGTTKGGTTKGGTSRSGGGRRGGGRRG